MKFKQIAAILTASSVLSLSQCSLNASSIDELVQASSKEQVAHLYDTHRIHIHHENSLESKFEIVPVFGTDYELISKISECISNSQFSIRKQLDGSYLYTNNKKETANLWVVYDQIAKDSFEGLYYLSGNRSFFDFNMLLHIQSKPNSDENISFRMDIYADTSSRLLRTFSKLSFVRNYIIREASRIITEFDNIYEHLTNNPEHNMLRFNEYRNPDNSLYFSDDDMKKIKEFYNMIQ
jgi:hypothetical protein